MSIGLWRHDFLNIDTHFWNDVSRPYSKGGLCIKSMPSDRIFRRRAIRGGLANLRWNSVWTEKQQPISSGFPQRAFSVISLGPLYFRIKNHL
jgi:hypothetical protein